MKLRTVLLTLLLLGRTSVRKNPQKHSVVGRADGTRTRLVPRGLTTRDLLRGNKSDYFDLEFKRARNHDAFLMTGSGLSSADILRMRDSSSLPVLLPKMIKESEPEGKSAIIPLGSNMSTLQPIFLQAIQLTHESVCLLPVRDFVANGQRSRPTPFIAPQTQTRQVRRSSYNPCIP
jgi:hypothetical protein